MHWPVVSGKATSAGVSVVGMRVPNGLLGTLRAGGLVRTGMVPGVVGFPAETVFLPEALPALNAPGSGVQFIMMGPTF